MAWLADQVAISRSTLHKLERGDPGVSMGIYAAVLEQYGLLPRLGDLVDRRGDRAGLAFEAARLPRRIHGTEPTAGSPVAVTPRTAPPAPQQIG